jgi:CRP/FNR family transcriptional regulator, cyclic AMP receptor protein
LGSIGHTSGVLWEILSGLDEVERRAVLASAVRRRYRNGDSLFHQGDPGDSLHLLAKGHVAVRVVNPRGSILTLDVLAPGASFGEQSLLDPAARRTATIVAIGPVETMVIQRDAFADLQRRHPTVTLVLVELLAAQVRRLSEQLTDAYTMPAEQRVLKQLGRLAASFADENGATIPITQEDLANLAGTTRPTANRALQARVEEGTVVLGRGRIVVTDPARLRAD